MCLKCFNFGRSRKENWKIQLPFFGFQGLRLDTFPEFNLLEESNLLEERRIVESSVKWLQRRHFKQKLLFRCSYTHLCSTVPFSLSAKQLHCHEKPGDTEKPGQADVLGDLKPEVTPKVWTPCRYVHPRKVLVTPKSQKMPNHTNTLGHQTATMTKNPENTQPQNRHGQKHDAPATFQL